MERKKDENKHINKGTKMGRMKDIGRRNKRVSVSS
jgi:uncharacterized C2H2 Zn-finger protein